MNQLRRVAIIGLGSISDRHRANIKKIFPESTVYSMSSSGRILGAPPPNSDVIVSSIDELLVLALDLVVIASPSSFHLIHAMPFIDAGVPTFIEKPVLEGLIGYSNSVFWNKFVNSQAGVGYCLRYMPAISEVRRILDGSQLGRVYNVMLEVGQYLPDWRKGKDYRDTVSASKKLGGGALLELSHELDYAQWLFGYLELKYAHLRSSDKLGLEVEDLADVVLMSESNIVVNIHLDFLQKIPTRTCSIIGDGGRLDWDLIENSIQLYDGYEAHLIFSEPNWDRNLMYVEMLKDFIDGDRSKMATVSSSLKTVELIDQIKAFRDVRAV